LALENKVEEEAAPEREPGSYVDGLPVYSSNDVANHRDETTGVWISYKSGVYDITSFIKSHPGTITSMHLLYYSYGIIEMFQEEIRFYLEPGVLLSLFGPFMLFINNHKSWH
jgi:hypothetical protein